MLQGTTWRADILFHQLQTFTALRETKWGSLLLTCTKYFPIKCTDKINLQALKRC